MENSMNKTLTTKQSTGFKKKLIATAVASALFGMSGMVMAQDDNVEEVVVLGVKGAQQSAINTKRDSAAIVDGISAEDIGKLPDVTIADSLQRISGVQVQRDAGEGTRANIRGLPQVVTLMNGEQYLSAGNLAGAQPTLGDIPSQLMRGVDVYKSTDLTNPLSGISGTIDLKTRRPMQLDEGFTAAVTGEVSTGEDTRETDPGINGLINWRNDKVGFMLAGVESEANLGNNYSGTAGGLFGNNDWGGSSPTNFIAPHGYESFNRVVERNRTGLNAAFELDLGEGFTFVAEGFYTKLEEHDRKVGINISNRWGTLDWLTPTDFTDTGVAGTNDRNWLDVNEYDVKALWVNSFTVNRTTDSMSQNYNLELNYDNGGNFTGQFRAIRGSANRLSINGQSQGDLSGWHADGPTNADGRFTLFRNADDRTRGTFYPADVAARYANTNGYSNALVGDKGGRFVEPNPGGYNGIPRLHYDISGDHPVWSGFDNAVGSGKSLREYMADKNAYAIGAFSSEGNNESSADLDVFSAMGNYRFDEALGGFLTSVDLGVRDSDRVVNIEQFHMFSAFYPGTDGWTTNEDGVVVRTGGVNEAGCQAQWKAIDVAMDQSQCKAGELVNGVFQPYTVNAPTRIDTHNNAIWVDDFGSVTSGIPGVWAADPRDYDDAIAFHKKVFGQANRQIVPGQTYDVSLGETSYTMAGNFETGPVTGNLGVKIIQTSMLVKQNLTGETLNYGDTNVDAGDTVTTRKYTDVLPALNLSYNLSDEWKFRFSASETMTPLDLGNYGGGLKINTADNADLGIRVVTGAESSGNPNLDPWRATNLDLASEYYFGDASMAYLGLFSIDIDSFVTNGKTRGSFPDQDGVIRREVDVSQPIQGKGGTIEGLEIGTKLAFSDFTDGFFGNFGVDTNYTYSPSEQEGKDLSGEPLPFNDNSENQFNLIGWYQDDKLQMRIAYNYRSDRLVGGATGGVLQYQDATAYVDANISYDILDDVTVYLNGSNITGEIETYYADFSNGDTQYLSQNEFEPRYTLGVRAKF